MSCSSFIPPRTTGTKMAKLTDALKVASLLLDLKRMWSVVNDKNPITPARIVNTLKRIRDFFTVAVVLIMLTGCESKTNVKVYTHVPTNVHVETDVHVGPTQVLPDPKPELVIRAPEKSVLIPTPEQVIFDVAPPTQPKPEKSVLLPSVEYPKPHDYDVRIWAKEGKYNDGGSGTLFRADAVVTCYHTFRDATGPITVTFPDGTVVEGKLVDVDKVYDLATVTIKPVDYTPATISTSKNLKGTFEVHGYGAREQKFRVARGSFKGWRAPNNKGAVKSTLLINATCRSGDSGGAIFNDGGLYGVIWGCNEDGVHGTSGAGFRQYINKVSSKLNAPSKEACDFRNPANKLIVYSNPKICTPCARLMPILESLKQQGYNVSHEDPLPDQKSMPMLVFFNDDQEVSREFGFEDEATLKTKLRK